MVNRPMRDITQDFLLVDDLASGTFKVDGSPDVTLTDCVLSRPITVRELEPSGGHVIRRGSLFDWPKDRTVEPPLGSIFVDDAGTYWTIWRMADRQHVGVYSSICLNLNISSEVFNVATLLKAQFVKGAANEASAVWKGYVSHSTTPNASDQLPARFQPSEETARLLFGADWSELTYRVTLKQPLQIELASGSYRLVDTYGNRYRVIRYFQESRLDRFPVAIAVRVTEGQEYHGR